MKPSYLKYFSFLGIAFLLSSCGKLEDFGNTNVNPNGSQIPVTSALLTNAESQLGGLASSTKAGLFCQYFSQTFYTNQSNYRFSEVQQDFEATYSGLLYDLQNIINQNTDPATAAAASLYGSNKSQVSVATIIKSYVLWTITDRWGDIPYSQSLKGVIPAYDRQENIYKGLIDDLKFAVSNFGDGEAAVQGDILYAGDVVKWKKLANSLRMLMALRLSKRYPNVGEYAQQEFRAAVEPSQGGIIEDNSDNFVIDYPGGVYQNPWYGVYDQRNDFGESKTFYDLLNGLNDSRQSALGSSTNAVPYGMIEGSPWLSANTNTYSKVLANQFRTQDADVAIVKASVVNLARAEGALLEWVIEDPKESYEKGIAASFEEWGVTIPSDYLTSSGVLYGDGGGSTKLQKIALQSYIAYYPDGIQGYCNWRRTGYPDLTPSANALNSSGEIPRRFPYGQQEYNLNGSNVRAAVSLLPLGDVEIERVWWDKQ